MGLDLYDILICFPERIKLNDTLDIFPRAENAFKIAFALFHGTEN